jgi:hypothetical protein
VESELNVERRPESVGGPGEDRNDAVALSLFDGPDPPMEDHGGAEQFVVAGDGGTHGIGIRLPQQRRARDVGEKKGDGSYRQVERGLPGP